MNVQLKAAILARHRTQWEFARQSGLREAELSAIISGRREPSPALRERVAGALGVSVGDVFPETVETEMATA